MVMGMAARRPGDADLAIIFYAADSDGVCRGRERRWGWRMRWRSTPLPCSWQLNDKREGTDMPDDTSLVPVSGHRLVRGVDRMHGRPQYQRPAMPSPPQYRRGSGVTGAVAGGRAVVRGVRRSCPAGAGQAGDRDRNLICGSPSLMSRRRGRSPGLPSRTFILRSMAPRGRRRARRLEHRRKQRHDASKCVYGFRLSWEIDLFGRLRRGQASGDRHGVGERAGPARRACTLVGDVATNYYMLRELDLDLAIARDTLRLNDTTVSY